MFTKPNLFTQFAPESEPPVIASIGLLTAEDWSELIVLQDLVVKVGSEAVYERHVYR
jgi:hypothetical protein